jgi:hypothetical protein
MVNSTDKEMFAGEIKIESETFCYSDCHSFSVDFVNFRNEVDFLSSAGAGQC